jgi:hypothetical protein
MLKGKNVKEKAEYFWMYYKAPFLAVLAFLFISAYWVHAAVTEKELALSVMLVDSHAAVSEEKLEKAYAEYAGIDPDTLSFNNSYLFSDSSSGTYAMTSLSRFYSDIGTQKLDVCGFLEEDFEKYANADCFLDLRECLSEQELAAYGDALYYQDGKPVGIYTEALPGLKESGCYCEDGDVAMIGIAYNTLHVEAAADYIRYLS